ncbi:MAG: signal recognition particle-docking protein FtsY [Mycoplasmatales bacterium]
MFKKIKNAFEEMKMFYGIGISNLVFEFNKEFNKLFIDREFFDEDFFDDLEEKLIELDIMPNLAIMIRDQVEKEIYNQKADPKMFTKVVIKVINELLNYQGDQKLELDNNLNVWLVIGVNGVGKTTTISKLANLHKDKNIELVAADTFRAGAIAQLSEWANRLNVPIVATHQGHAPSAVIYDGMDSAIRNKRELLICDTAGRLHNKSELMNELKKIHSIIVKKTEEEVMTLKTVLVLDGTAGKNTIEQARIFNEITKVDGVIITKLDTGGKAGVVINVAYELNVPIYYITTGEAVENLAEFKFDEYFSGMFEV